QFYYESHCFILDLLSVTTALAVSLYYRKVSGGVVFPGSRCLDRRAAGGYWLAPAVAHEPSGGSGSLGRPGVHGSYRSAPARSLQGPALACPRHAPASSRLAGPTLYLC